MLNYNFWLPNTPLTFKFNLFEFSLNFDNFSILDLFNPFDLFFLGFQSVLFSFNSILIFSQLDILFNLIFKSLFKYDGLTFVLSFYLDNFNNIPLYFKFFLYSNSWFYYDSFISFYLNAPEFIFFSLDFLQAYFVFGSDHSVRLVYEHLNYSTNYLFIEFFDSIVWLLILLLLLILFLQNFRIMNLIHHGESIFIKLFFFLWSFSTEQRINFNLTFNWFTFFFFIWIPLLMTYDDQNTELVELIHFFIIFIFVILIFMLLYKYSIHYFSFLENSISDGFSVHFILKQFVRDVANSFALFLRFFLLIFRLNIYDGLDDFLDSYYIFFIDFDEDNYFDESFIISDNFFFLNDNHEDLIYKSTIEYSIWFDLYSKYFILITKFLFFWIFILEEIFRVTLALYISYLIIFEIHSVNTSYNEDKFYK